MGTGLGPGLPYKVTFYATSKVGACSMDSATYTEVASVIEETPPF